SLRQFSPQTQRSLNDLNDVELTGGGVQRPAQGRPLVPQITGHLCEYLPGEAWTVLVEPDDLNEQGKHYLERVSDGVGLFSVRGVMQQLLRFPSVQVSALPLASAEVTCHLHVESVERFSGNVAKLHEELQGVASGDRVLIACHNEAERQRLTEILHGDKENGRQGDKETPEPN